jgi:hypothetical protein
MKSVPYTPTVGSLMYAMVSMRPDIAHAIGIVSRFMHPTNFGALQHEYGSICYDITTRQLSVVTEG